MKKRKKVKNPIEWKDGVASWTQQKGDLYKVTGVDRYGKRFSVTYESWSMARMINVWQGNKWLVRNGCKFRLQEIYN